MIRTRTGALLGAALWLCSGPASATYSIVAVDTESGQVGGAGTSCVGDALSVSEIYGSVPGAGVLVAQAAINRAGRDRAVELLTERMSASAIMADITAEDFDPLSAIRQYAVIDSQGNAAGFTGTSTMPYANDVQGTSGEFVYSVQGNILTSAAVLDQAASAFEMSGCDLADKLMLALEAGADDGEGDSRCTPDGIPSDGAFIQVDLASGIAGSYLRLRVDDSRPDSPLVQLRTAYDAWRGQHPCASTADAGSGLDAGVDAAVPAGRDAAVAAGSGAAGVAAGTGGIAPTPTAGTGGMEVPGPPAGGATPSAGAGGQGAGPIAGQDTARAESGGCGVAARSGWVIADPGLLALFAALAARRTRRAS